jgi:hypothetical protein
MCVGEKDLGAWGEGRGSSVHRFSHFRMSFRGGEYLRRTDIRRNFLFYLSLHKKAITKNKKKSISLEEALTQ